MTATRKRAGRPTTTSREAILAAALALLKEGGEQALSFRKLAERLGLSAPSIYTYFANKQSLLLALVECALQLDVGPAVSNAAPQQELRQLLDHLRARLLENRHLLFLFGSAMPAEAMLQVIETLAAVIEKAGIARPQALRHAQSLLWMVLGFAVFEARSLDAEVLQEFAHLPERYADTLSQLDLDSHERLWQLTLDRNLHFLQ
ncbi:MAG TPA: TetR/AcrR family transcriptional regulator [Pseudomonadales bacterium]